MALVLLLSSAQLARAEPPPDIDVSVITETQRELRQTGVIDLRVRAIGPARVRVGASALGRRIGPRRTLTFSRAGSQRVSIPLRVAGRRAARACGRLRVNAAARGTFAGPPPGDTPVFAGRVGSVRRASRVLAPDPRGCYRVGMATRSINPSADGTYAGRPVHLGGYGFGGPPMQAGRAATGILGDGAQVRAITIADGERRIAVANMEEQGWFAATKDGPYGIVDIRKAVEAETGGRVKAEDVVVQSNHSHSGADTIGVWGGVPVEYREFVMRQTVAAVVAATEGERPGTLFYGTAPGEDLLSNQFEYDESNRVLDSDVRVLQARDPDGSAFATLLNFSAHTTVLGGSNTKLTGDWPTRANRMLAERFGGEAMTMMATLGRTQPRDRGCQDTTLPEDGDERSLCALDEYATRVVERTVAAADAAEPIDGAPLVDARSYLIQDVGTSPLILGLNYAGDPFGAPINRSLSPPWLTGNVIGTVTASARIGDVLLSVVPGEAYPQIPLKVSELVPGLRGHMTAGLGNDQLGYLIAPYEAYPEPIRRSFFNERGDEVSPIDNDNFFFNVSPTMGDRVTCSLLRGAGELRGEGVTYRSAYDRCAPFANDLALEPGADVP